MDARVVVSPVSRAKGFRPSKEEIEARRSALFDIVAAMRPMIVRQVYYQATVRGLVEKTELGYDKVQADLVLMRRSGALPYHWLVDNTRWVRRPLTYSSIGECLDDAARSYRKSLWTGFDVRVEIWLEKDALAGVIDDVTYRYDVPLMVSRGYASLSFLHEAAEAIAASGTPVFIYHLGDFDPSGVNAGEKIEQTLRELAPGAEIHFERLAVTPQQITDWKLPTRPTKASDSRAKSFDSVVSVELDAIAPGDLRGLVEKAIERHMPPARFAWLMDEEESERARLAEMIERLAG